MSPKTPSQNQKIREETRQKIKDAAFELFAEQGFTQTSVSSIAQQAGKSKGLIYHYFDSKEEILQAIFDDLTELGDQAMDFPEGLEPKGELKYLLETIFGYIRESSEVIRLMMALALQPDAVAKLKSSIDQYNKHQLKIMTDLFTALGYDDPEAEAYYLGAKLDGITLGVITLGDDYPIETIKEKIMNEYVTTK